MPVMERTQSLERAVSFNRILIATDLSEASEGAERWGLAFARYYHAEAYLVHAMAARGSCALEEQGIKTLTSDLNAKQIVTHIRMQRQPPVDLISRVVDTENIDLLVLGTHGRGGLKKVVLGSVAEELSRVVPCPVLTISRHVPPITLHGLTFAHILLATDFGRAAEESLRYALCLAEEHNARLTILHTIPPMPLAENIPAAFCPAYYAAEEVMKWQTKKRKESIEKMESLVTPDARLAFEPEYAVTKGFLPDNITEVAHQRNADLIVMGAHTTDAARMAAHDPGTMLHSVIVHAHCPVLTVTSG